MTARPDDRLGSIGAIAIVVPVKDEAAALPSCLAGIDAAVAETRRQHVGLPVAVVFALDRCTDDSAEIIRSSGHRLVESRSPGVGAARAAGVAAALKALGRCAPDHLWIACTDADSVVPAYWLTRQLELANAGADIVIGSVRPGDGDLDDERQAAWDRTHGEGQAIGHVHGANLGVRANYYRAVGGFASLYEHEDVDLVIRATVAGARTVAAHENCVVTSGRLHGRTEGGYAGFLRDQLIALAESRSQPGALA